MKPILLSISMILCMYVAGQEKRSTDFRARVTSVAKLKERHPQHGQWALRPFLLTLDGKEHSFSLLAYSSDKGDLILTPVQVYSKEPEKDNEAAIVVFGQTWITHVGHQLTLQELNAVLNAIDTETAPAFFCFTEEEVANAKSLALKLSNRNPDQQPVPTPAKGK